MSLITWKQKCCDPLDNFFEFDENNFGWFKKGAWLPAIDVSEEKEAIVVKADLPGMTKEDVALSVDGTVLTIRGERKTEEEKKDKKYYRLERTYGAFERRLDLGVAIDQNNIKAKYHNGVLEVTVSKVAESQAKKIDIESN